MLEATEYVAISLDEYNALRADRLRAEMATDILKRSVSDYRVPTEETKMLLRLFALEN